MDQNEITKKILEKLDRMDKKFEERFVNLDQKIDGVEQSILSKMDERFDQFESKILKHGNDQTRLVVEAMESLENRLSGRVERMEVRQAKTADRLDVIEADVTILKNKLAD